MLSKLRSPAGQKSRPNHDYFRIPDRPPPTWQTFFDKVLKTWRRAVRESATTDLMGKAGWQLEDEGISESRWLCPQANERHVILRSPLARMQSTHKGPRVNKEFKKGNIDKALTYYASSIQTFPLPDAISILRRLLLKTNRFLDLRLRLTFRPLTTRFIITRFPLAEQSCTNALDIGLISSSIIKIESTVS